MSETPYKWRGSACGKEYDGLVDRYETGQPKHLMPVELTTKRADGGGWMVVCVDEQMCDSQMKEET